MKPAGIANIGWRTPDDLRLDEMTVEQKSAHMRELLLAMCAMVAAGTEGFAIVLLGDGHAHAASSLGLARIVDGRDLEDVPTDADEVRERLCCGLRVYADTLDEGDKTEDDHTTEEDAA